MTDLNGDDLADAVIVKDFHYLSVLLGKGDGSFQPQSQTFTIDRLVDIVDMNGDGRIDVVAIVAGRLSVFLGKGDGSYQELAQTNSDIEFRAITLGDLNGDGILDAAVVAPSHLGQTLFLFIGEVDGTFQEQQILLERMALTVLGLRDINGDGIIDVVAISNWSDLLVFLGSADNTFQTVIDAGYIEELDLMYSFFDDLNGDGRSDLITIMFQLGFYGWEDNLEVRLGGDDGKLRSIGVLKSGYLGNIKLGDLNRDGDPDMVFSDWVYDGSENLFSIKVLLGNGNDGFHPEHTVKIGYEPSFLYLADLNGDELLDIVHNIRERSQMVVLLGNGDGSFQPQHRFQNDDSGRVFLVDVNGDDRLDVVIGHGDNITVMSNQSTFLASP
jgi:hypothetical protein